jgi:hypothetical protein
MSRCPVCQKVFTPDNPESRTLVLADDQGEAVWLPVCRACAQELEECELSTGHQ